MRNIVAFISSVMAGIVANFISKWLDRRKKGAASLRHKPPRKNGIEKPEVDTFGLFVVFLRNIIVAFPKSIIPCAYVYARRIILVSRMSQM